MKLIDSFCVPKVMGILNKTPDSFYDGGFFHSDDKALSHTESMINQGASIIDVGAESTRPDSSAISVQEELDRLATLVLKLKERFSIPLSIDTRHPEVMEACLRLGANWINDVQALQAEGALDVIRRYQPEKVCLMHMKGSPETMQQAPAYENILEEIGTFFQQRIQACEEAGLKRSQIVLDPGFGFGKNLKHNLHLLNHLEVFKRFKLPVLIGLSRKSMIGAILNVPPSERLIGSLAATSIAVMNGADFVRTHDVKETVECIKVVHALKMEQHEGNENE